MFPSSELREELHVLAKPDDCFINIYKSDTVFLSPLALAIYYLEAHSSLPCSSFDVLLGWEGIRILTFFFDLLACTLGVFVEKLRSEVFKGGLLGLPHCSHVPKPNRSLLVRFIFFCRRKNPFSKFVYQQRRLYSDRDNVFCLS